jgi:thiamine pyrophosphate-dependent acetolactate synthase large subunit-like protein
MKVIEYVRHMTEVVPQDAIFVASHTDNSSALISLQLANKSFLGFNMGFATSIGAGLALALPHRRVFILDGDGGVLLQSSALADLASQSPSNAVVIVADNESSLAFPSHSALKADIEAMAKGAGIENACTVRSLEEFKAEFARALARKGLTYIVAKTDSERVPIPEGVKPPLVWENKFNFVRYIEETEKLTILKPFGGAM